MKTEQPSWTVGYNIVSDESDQWIGTGWEFFDNESDAKQCYTRLNSTSHIAWKRPFHSQDAKHLGAVHT